MTILIPAYEPTEQLIQLIKDIQKEHLVPILIVDDGSGPAYESIFSHLKQLGCHVLTHKKNLGKGQALKTGFRYLIEKHESEGVVCADSDGQHLPADIWKIMGLVRTRSNQIVMGTRRFVGYVPLKSRFGNGMTRNIFAFSSGVKLFDTQTGLRGFPADMLPWLMTIKGARFEYEMQMLLEAKNAGYGFLEVGIDTVYNEGHHSTHFRAIRDSFRVYWPILKFTASSFVSGILNFVLVMLFELITHQLLFAVVGARFISAIVNYAVNKRMVFKQGHGNTVQQSLPKYALLAGIVLLANYQLIHLFNELFFIPLFFAKLVTEIIIFLFSFWCQRKFVFRHN